jgi:very-short-patch-repair endonuclease
MSTPGDDFRVMGSSCGEPGGRVEHFREHVAMDPRLRALAEQRFGVFTTSDAERADVRESALRALRRHHEVIQLRRGAYVLAAAWEAASPEGRLALRTRAVLRTRAARPGKEGEPCAADAACHQSTLALYELPLHGVRLDVVDLVSDVNRVRLASGLRTQPGRHPTAIVQGVRSVTLPVALAQVLQRSGLLAALVPLDEALRRKKCTVGEVAAAIDSVCGQGSSIGARLVELADPKSESVGETRTRLLLHDLGYEVLSQVSVLDERHSFVARVDFLVNKRIVVEFDGLRKYDGAQGRAALVREKRREDRLRALGYVVVRLVWSDLDHPDRVARMMQVAMRQVQRSAG